MSATDEELNAVHETGMDHVTYVLSMYRWASSGNHLTLVGLVLSQHCVPDVPPHRLPAAPLLHIWA